MHMLQSILMFLGSIILLLVGVFSVLHDLIARDLYPVETRFDEGDSIDQHVAETMEAERSHVKHNPR